MEEFNNKTYFTLKEASKLFGYSPDYLGFLVRKRKIKGKRTYNIRWQMTKKELLTYCKERKKKIKKPHLFNKKLTLKQASRISGYSPDYIGQLLRTGKLKGKRIKTQVSWLVEKQNIENYREGREERQSNTRKPLRFSFIKIRRKQLVLIGRRLFASTFVLIYFISGIAPTDFLLASIGAFFIEEPETINLYSQLAEGDWQNPRRAQGPPDISLDKDITSFSESNSAVYQTGPLSLVLKDFDSQEDISNYLFNSAQIKISFAIGEKETDLSVIEEPEQETTTSTEEQISFWNKIKQFFNSLLTSIRSIVFKALSVAKAEEEQVQETQEPEQPDEIEQPEDIKEGQPVEEEGQFTIGEDEDSPLDQDTWLDEIIEESEEEEEDPPAEEQIPEQELSEDMSLATSTEEVEDEQPPEEIPEQPSEEQLSEIELLPTDRTTTTETEATTTQEELSPVEEITTSSDEVIATSSDEVSEGAPPEPEPDILPNLDAKIIIYWSLDIDNENWQVLDTISSYPLSNHLNNGYLTYNTPFLTDWQDINNLQIKFEGVIGGQTNIISYLDSVWITAEYEEQAEEETEETVVSDEEEQQQAPPAEDEQPTDEGGGGGDEESPLDQDTWLDEMIEESEEEESFDEAQDEQPPEETEETEETEEAQASSDEGEDEEQEEEQPSDDESTEGEAEEETEESEAEEEEPEEQTEEELEEKDLEEEPKEPEEDSEQPPEEEEDPEEEKKPIKKLRKLKIKDKDLIFSFQKKDFTSNEDPFFIISTPDFTIEELLNTDKAEEILEEEEEDEALPEVEPMATSTIATSTDELATSTEEIEEEEDEELPEEIEEESEEETITTTTESIIEQATTTEATSTEEESFDEAQDEQPPEETEEEQSDEAQDEQPPEEVEDSQESEEETEETEEQLEEECEDLTLLEKIKIFFENIILALKQGIQKIVSIIIRIVKLQIPSVKAQSANNLKLTIIQPDGRESPLTPQITTTYINGKEVFEIKLQKPETGLQPGLYKLQIEIETSEAIFISEQEFTWGVLAINVNKSVCVPTEQAYIQMAALNEWGHTLCDANLELRIKHLQSGAQVRLSTLHGTIKKSGQCGPNNVVDVPDYYAYYNVEKPGIYEMTLKNLDTGYEITDSFKAQNFVSFDVERIGPTRIWPWAPYQMTLNIKANQDFEGQIIETVPQGFEISNQEVKIKNNGFATIPNSSFIIQEKSTSSEKNLVWENINLTQGDELQITYEFDAPDISPYLFLLGPLSFQGTSIQNIENREEQELPKVEPIATSTLATTTDLAEVGPLATTTNATGSEELEAPSDQNGTTTKLESFTFTFQEARKWQLASDAANLNQHSFIFENDDANDVNSNSNMESANATATDVKKGQRLVARFQLDNTGDPSTTTFKLQYDKQDDQWIDIDYGGAPNINSWASSSDWNATTVDSSLNMTSEADYGNSLAIGNDGYPIIAYKGGNNLLFLKCGNPSCTSGNVTTTVDEVGDVGGYTSIAIGSDDYPVISYYDDTNDNLNFAKCTTDDCTAKSDWATTTVDEMGDVGGYTSIAIGTDGLPIISYTDNSNGYLLFAKCTTDDCTAKSDWATTTVDNTVFGNFTSITINVNGLPVIAYYDNIAADNLHFAECTTEPCTNSGNWSNVTLDSAGDVGACPSIAVGADGYPVISYFDDTNDNLKFAKCISSDCTNVANWTTTTLDTEGDVGRRNSIAISTDGNPVISYYDNTNKSLKIAKCKDASCSGATSSQVLISVASSPSLFGTFNGIYTSITIGWDGWPVISYYDDTNDNLKVAKMRPLVEIQPAWGLSGSSGDALNATQAGSCITGTSWTNGKWLEATTTGTIGIGANECTELAFVLDTVEATASTTYRLRLVKEDGTLLDSYSEYPALKIVKESNNTLRYSKEAIMTSGSSCNVDDWECNTVDSQGDVGRYSSIAIGTDGNPVISYWDGINYDLEVAKCGNPSCTSGNTTTTVDGGGNVGKHSSIAIGTDGFPVISYYDDTLDNLNFAKCGNPSCTSGNTTTTVDSSGDVGDHSSIAIGTDGNPVIAYWDGINYDLEVAKCGNPSCTSGNTLTTVKSTGDVAQFTSIAIGTDGNPVISYYRHFPAGEQLEVAKCNDPACSGGDETISIVDSPDVVGKYTSIAIGTDGYPVISYFDETSDNLKVAKCNDPACSGGDETITIIDSTGNVGEGSSIVVGIDGRPVISYFDDTNNNLLVAKCGNSSCSLGNSTTSVDSIGVEANTYYTSIAIGVDGYPVISYFDDTNNNLKVAKQLGLPKTAISYFNRYIKTDAQVKISRNMWSGPVLEGPNNPATIVNDDESHGSISWTTPEDADESDNQTANCILGAGNLSYYLKATDFGFSIPGGATINGIVVEVERHAGIGGDIYDGDIKIVKNGNIGSEDKEKAAAWLAFGDIYYTYGSNTDLWSEEWTVSDINNSTFGFVLAARCTSGSANAYVDHIRITVYYEIPALYLEASPAIEDGLQYKFDKADYSAAQTVGDSSFSNATSTGGTSTSTPMFVFTDKHSTNAVGLYAKWQGQSTLAASDKNIVLQLYRFGNSTNTTGWVTTTVNTTCSANTDCTLEYSTTTDLEDFFYPEYKFNDSTGTTSADYWTFWRVFQEEATGSLSPPTLKTDLWQIETESTLTQRAYIFENDDGNTVNENSDMSAVNTTTTDLKKGQRFIARFQLDNTGTAATNTFKLQYDKQDSQWIDIDYGGAPNINSGASSSDWNVATVGSTSNNVGKFTSLAIGDDGNPIISYFDDTSNNLMFVKCGNPSCSSGNQEVVVDGAGSTNLRTSIAVGTDSRPVISYYDDSGGEQNLKFARCTTGDCTQSTDWSTSTLVSPGSGNVGRYNSIAIGSDGYPVISYLDDDAALTYGLKVYHCTNISCTGGSSSDVQGGEHNGYYNSMAIGTDGYPVIAYMDDDTKAVTVAKCDDVACSGGGETITGIEDPGSDTFSGYYISIAVPSDGKPVISYWDGDKNMLKIAKCGNLSCSSGNTINEISGVLVRNDTSIAVGLDGNPIISHPNRHGSDYVDLSITKCSNMDCSAANSSAYTTITIETKSSLSHAAYSSITIGRDGWPVISYYDGDNGDLKVAKMRPLVEIQPAWGLSGSSGDALNAIQAGSCVAGTSWTNGKWYEATTTGTIGIGANECTELAFVLDTVEATASTTYRLRLVKEDGTLLDSYSEYPALKIVKETENTLRYSKEAIMTSGSSCGNTTEYECTKISYDNEDVGSDSSLAIGTDGYPVVAYWNSGASPDTLLITKCSSADCSSISTTTEISYDNEQVGRYPSLAIGTDGYPVIAHWNWSASPADTLLITKCSSADCSSISTTTEISYDNEDVGLESSIAIGTDGYPVIAHRNSGASPDTLLITKCSSADCSSISTTTEISYDNDNAGSRPSLAIGTDGYPVIAHSTSSVSHNLLITKCSSVDCSSISTTTEITYDNVSLSSDPSLAIGTDGYPVIAHSTWGASPETLLITKCSSADCSSISTTTEISYDSEDVGSDPSLAIGADGYPVIAHRNFTGTDSLMVTKCSSADCTSVATTTEISYDSEDVGSDPSLAIGADGYPVIAHQNLTGTDSLMVTKQLGLPKTAISYFNRYIKTDGQIKISRNMWSGIISEGPNNPDPASVVNDASYGTIAWSNPSRATNTDDYYASVALGSNEISNYLKATDFGFSIPGGATINGIVVEVERYDTGAVRDSRVSIVKGGSIESTDKAKVVDWGSEAYQTYGDSTDLWGETWTTSDINSSNFGIAISGYEPHGFAGNIGYIDHIRITVYYEIPALYLEASPAIEDGLLYKADKADYTAVDTDDDNFSNVTSTGGTSTSTPMFVFADRHTTNTTNIYTQWKGQSTLGAGSKNIVLQVFRFGNSTNTTGWVTTTEETTCTADSDCTIEASTTTDLTDFYFPEYRFNDSTGTTTAYYWTFWRIYQKQATGAETPPTLKTDLWQIGSGPFATGFIKQYHIRWRNDDGGE